MLRVNDRVVVIKPHNFNKTVKPGEIFWVNWIDSFGVAYLKNTHKEGLVTPLDKVKVMDVKRYRHQEV